MTMQLTEHFSLEEMTASEWAQRHDVENLPPPAIAARLKSTAENMELIRALLGVAIHVNSGYRSPQVNQGVGGAPTSAHCDGYAVDFQCPQKANYEAAQEIAGSDLEFDQLILEYGWVHISFAPAMRRELLTKRSMQSPYEPGLHA
jgi:hypothetical protein